MLLLDPVPTDDAESEKAPTEEIVKSLCEQSVRLQEYSRSLRERSQEINRRIQAYLNSKRAV
jgi:hypothetical protein